MSTTFTVSELFIDIYKNFNVIDQTERLPLLTEKESYILLNLIIERHSEEDPQVVKNLSTSVEKINNLKSLFEIGETQDEVLNSLSTKYGRYLNIPLQDSNSQELPEPYTREEVRELKLNNIFDK